MKADLGQALVCPDLFLRLYLASPLYTASTSGKHPCVALAMRTTLHFRVPSASVRAGDCSASHLLDLLGACQNLGWCLLSSGALVVLFFGGRFSAPSMASGAGSSGAGLCGLCWGLSLSSFHFLG